jgi:hypothetical protein
MHWKVLLSLMLIILISGVFLITPIGQKYSESIRGFFTKNVGSVISTFSTAVLKTKPSGYFTVYLSASKESFYGQSFKVSNSTLSITGTYQNIRIGDQTLNSKSNKEANININNLNGVVEMMGNGNLRVSASSGYFEVGDYIFSSARPVKIEAEFTPSTFSLTPLVADKIVFSSVTGEIKRLGELTNTASLSNSKLEIRSFNGYIKLELEGSMSLHGLSNNVKGDTFNFV